MKTKKLDDLWIENGASYLWMGYSSVIPNVTIKVKSTNLDGSQSGIKNITKDEAIKIIDYLKSAFNISNQLL